MYFGAKHLLKSIFLCIAFLLKNESKTILKHPQNRQKSAFKKSIFDKIGTSKIFQKNIKFFLTFFLKQSY